MFELDWAKLLIIMIVAIVVVGPKELPGMLRTLGRALAVLRRHAEQFRAQFEQSLQEITKDVGVDDIKNDLRKLNELNPANQIRETLDQAVRGVPTPRSYLRGEPAAGAAMAAFEEPKPEPQPEAQTEIKQPIAVPHQEAAPAPLDNKEKLEQAAVH